MKRDGAFFWILVAALALGTAYMFFSRTPEDVAVQSVDGRVTVSGVARKSQTLRVVRTDEMLTLPLVGNAYTVSSTAMPIDRPLTLVFSVADLGLADNDAALFLYDDATMMWEPQSPSFAIDGVLSLRTTSLGTYAAGMREDVAAPTFVEAFDALRALAPVSTSAYTIDVGYAKDGAPTVLLPALAERGGCGGVFGTGDGRTHSRVARTASVPVNGVATTVTFSFVATWFSGLGCAEGKTLEPSGEHGIIPLSH